MIVIIITNSSSNCSDSGHINRLPLSQKSPTLLHIFNTDLIDLNKKLKIFVKVHNNRTSLIIICHE